MSGDTTVADRVAEPSTTRTTCVIVGGGPAGMFLSLVLARAGVDVTVLEKHGDFLRDFRGDTVHISTLNILDELGLGDAFAALPQQRSVRGSMQLDQGSVQMADMSRLRGKHRYLALVPQWDLLDLLAETAQREPTFHLRQNAEVTELIRDEGRIVGVRYTDRADGSQHEMTADLTVACDGRGSVVASEAGLVPHQFAVPMDVWWFRLPRLDGDPATDFDRSSAGDYMVMIDRGEYWQCAYLVPKGADASRRAEGLAAFRDRLRRIIPWLGDRLDALDSFDDVLLLKVSLSRQRRWFIDGLLLIGDAAHTMSPVGGVGINLAIADAVAAGRILAPSLRTPGRVPLGVLRQVQRRRALPMVIIQGLQRTLHKQLGAALARQPDPNLVPAGGADPRVLAPTTALPLPLKMMRRFPALQALPAWMTGVGPRPEHAPWWSRGAS